ncbi:MAG: hypothetical protein LUI60_02045 [Clostridia bacterium]|nr:hypothetical protein [Clostridia bacterium]
MKIIKRLRRINYMHYICIAITVTFLLCTAFLFTNSLNRIIESFRDFGISIAYYFCELLHLNYSITVTVTQLPALDLFPTKGAATVDLPETWNGFKENFIVYWQLWTSKDNLFGYLSFLGDWLYILCNLILIAMPLVLVMFILFKRISAKTNNDYGKDSKPLKVFKKITTPYYPVKGWILSFVCFVKEHRYYFTLWLGIWALNFNLITIFVEFIAYYLYLCVSFDFISLYLQVYKLAIDLATPICFIPWYIWLVIGVIFFDYTRKKIAYARLTHMERKNCGFINERPIVTMAVGTMGKGKTTMLTDMCLSTEVMFRNKAFEKLLENDLKFPYFPWVNFEYAFKWAIRMHEVYNLATCRIWVRKKYERWNKNRCREKLFGYDYNRYGYTYNNKLQVVNIWQVLETYAQLYFIYVMESSLIISNYSIRSDVLLSDMGNFPLWNGDFFRRDSRLQEAYSRHAHILDFDMLRLGRTVVEENKQSNAFEFGIVAVSEIGKERRNALENREKKKSAEEANQLNDGFNDGLKMRRHSATVDNYAFIKIISDEQRPESLGADARDMFDVVYIKERSDSCLAMPFFSLSELIYSWLYNRYNNFFAEYRYNRGDNTLTYYLLKSIMGKAYSYYTGIYNRFGFNTLHIQIENGTLDGVRKDGKYYLSWKKVYSNRFSTDCMSAFWSERALNSAVGLNDINEYETTLAAWNELKAQNSYFVRDTLLMGLEGNNNV